MTSAELPTSADDGTAGGTPGGADADDPTVDRVAVDAAARGIAIEFQETTAAGSLDEAAAQRGITLADIVKTLVVKRHDGDYLLALVPGDRQIAWPKLRALVGVNKLRLPDPDAAFAATGYVRGTITPFGSTTPWPVYADERIVRRRVSMGAGRPGRALTVDADALIAGFDAVVADITVPRER